MPCGLFGKLPAKRDFIAISASAGFLRIWEPWIQAGISGSRLRLGDGWQEFFLRAPIWRFWLGRDAAGAAVLGALMPSVDGVGRYFPLTVFAEDGDRGSIPPPEIDPHEAWFAAAEELLLSTLRQDVGFESTLAALQQLDRPAVLVSDIRPDETVRLPEGTLVSMPGPEALSDHLAALRVMDHARIYAGATFWWTSGGEGYQPRILVGKGLPDPYVFTGMLTGSFEALQGGAHPGDRS